MENHFVEKVDLVIAVKINYEQVRNGKKKISVGPWGGNGGTSWDDGCYSGVRNIKLVYDRCIDSIMVAYDKNGKPVKADKHGGNGGNITVEEIPLNYVIFTSIPPFRGNRWSQQRFHLSPYGPKIAPLNSDFTQNIKLNYPEEYLTSVSGHYSPVVHGMTLVVRSLTFKSNKRTFGPFGMEEGTPFYFPMEGGRIIGFKGRSGWYVDSIGFYVSPVQSTTTVTKRLQGWLHKSLEHKSTKQSHAMTLPK